MYACIILPSDILRCFEYSQRIHTSYRLKIYFSELVTLKREFHIVIAQGLCYQFRRRWKTSSLVFYVLWPIMPIS